MPAPSGREAMIAWCCGRRATRNEGHRHNAGLRHCPLCGRELEYLPAERTWRSATHAAVSLLPELAARPGFTAKDLQELVVNRMPWVGYGHQNANDLIKRLVARGMVAVVSRGNGGRVASVYCFTVEAGAVLERLNYEPPAPARRCRVLAQDLGAMSETEAAWRAFRETMAPIPDPMYELSNRKSYAS